MPWFTKIQSQQMKGYGRAASVLWAAPSPGSGRHSLATPFPFPLLKLLTSLSCSPLEQPGLSLPYPQPEAPHRWCTLRVLLFLALGQTCAPACRGRVGSMQLDTSETELVYAQSLLPPKSPSCSVPSHSALNPTVIGHGAHSPFMETPPWLCLQTVVRACPLLPALLPHASEGPTHPLLPSPHSHTAPVTRQEPLWSPVLPTQESPEPVTFTHSCDSLEVVQPHGSCSLPSPLSCKLSCAQAHSGLCPWLFLSVKFFPDTQWLPHLLKATSQVHFPDHLLEIAANPHNSGNVLFFFLLPLFPWCLSSSNITYNRLFTLLWAQSLVFSWIFESMRANTFVNFVHHFQCQGQGLLVEWMNSKCYINFTSFVMKCRVNIILRYENLALSKYSKTHSKSFYFADFYITLPMWFAYSVRLFAPLKPMMSDHDGTYHIFWQIS